MKLKCIDIGTLNQIENGLKFKTNIKMSKYIIVKEETIQFLEMQVIGLISQGWKPQGGVYVAIDKYNSEIYYQAMVKDDDKQ